ncbi:MAG: AEC family transporter [Rhodospirillales bacterium]|nr:AEC family transporter [Rhodospirillales bacterium]
MLTVFESLLPVFALIGLGLLLRKRDIVPQDKWTGIEQVCFWLFFPAILAETLIKADLKSVPLTGVAATMLMAVFTMLVVMLALKPLLYRYWGMQGPAYTSVFQAGTRWNGFIALAIILKLFGDPGVAIVAVALAVMVPVINFENVLVLAAYASSERPPLKQVARKVLFNPLIWGCLIGLFINLLEIPIWDPVMTLLDLLGRAALGAGLLCVGAGLRVRHALIPSRDVVLGVMMKLVIMPMFVAGWAIAFGITGLSFQTALVCAAVPTAMNGFLLARQMGGDAELFAATVTVQTTLSFLSIPLILYLANLFTPI